MKSYKTELDPNSTQRTLFLRFAGARRWAFNWGLQRRIEEYNKNGNVLNAIDLYKELVVLKKTEIRWMYGISKWVSQSALRDLDKAFNKFFANIKTGSKPGFPKFKSKKRGVGGFRLYDPISVYEDCIQLPRIGKVRLKERGYLPFDNSNIKIISATVSEKAGRWFVSINVRESEKQVTPNTKVVGVDLGLHTLVTLSDGTKFENLRILASAEKKLKHLNQSLSRKKLGSKNREKAKHKLAKFHYRIYNIRKDTLHKISSAITKQFGIIGLEDLNVEGMKQSTLAKSISDVGLGELRRQIEYKTAWNGGKVVLVDRFYPSSKKCSGCGLVKEKLSLSERIFKCGGCGLEVDRDLNAAINLRNVAASESETLNACGENVRPGTSTGLISVKQEPNVAFCK